ncbi:MAG TPA: tRNA (adenosine(37)-N6)-dimethylallyltransferase MiaA [Acidimicrobiales bacterium]|nr:tRNA (adenosine(37)-N6)-dimethylallyltransferase MiaA [Acidimicrobiales bacterium]
MRDEAVPSRGDPTAAARPANSSAGECGVKDQVSRSGSPTSPRGGDAGRAGARGDAPRHLAIVGPTAAGKTALAVAVARAVPGIELVSVDAMAVYRGLDIGTAKPTAAERAGVRWHLVDLVEPSQEFSVARFQSAGRRVIAAIEERGHRALLVGGTGLYHRALLDDLELPGRYPDVAAALDRAADEGGLGALHARLSALDPVAASRIEPGNRRRIVRALEVTIGSGRPFSESGPGLERYGRTRFHQVGLALDRDVLDARVAARLDAQVAAGLLDEVARLRAAPGGLGRTARQALGYRELLAHLDGERSLADALDETLRRTRAFARRQQRWFARDPRVTWLRADDPGLAVTVARLAARDT